MSPIRRFFIKRRVLRNLDVLIFTLNFERDVSSAAVAEVLKEAEILKRKMSLNEKEIVRIRETFEGVTDGEDQKKIEEIQQAIAESKARLTELEQMKIQKTMELRQVTKAMIDETAKRGILASY